MNRYPFYIRMAAAREGTFLHIQGAFGRWHNGYWYEDPDASDWIHVYAIDGAAGNRLLTGVVTKEPSGAGYIATFEPAQPVKAGGFQIVIDQDPEWMESGIVTLTQHSIVVDPTSGSYTADFGDFTGSFSCSNTQGGRWIYHVYHMAVTGAYAAGNIRVTLQVDCTKAPPAMGGAYELPWVTPQLARGWSYDFTDGQPFSGEVVLYPDGSTWTWQDGYFAFKIGWGNEPWDLSATIKKLEWKVGDTYYDIWDGLLTTGNLAGLRRVDLYNFCPNEE
jgi:hypothetical protein